NDLPPWRVGLRVEAYRRKHLEHDPLVVARLLEVPLPLFPQVIVAGTPERGLVDLDPAHFRLERLIKELCLFFFHIDLPRRRNARGIPVDRVSRGAGPHSFPQVARDRDAFERRDAAGTAARRRARNVLWG